MKKFISGIILGSILATSVTAFAANSKTIQAVYSVKKLIVNGVDTGKGSSAFVSNGATYVPLRTVSDALGNEIAWDSDTKSIYINTKGNNNVSGEPSDLPPVNNGAVTLPEVAPTPAPAPAPTPARPQQNFIGEAKAKQIAINKCGGGQVISFYPDLYDNDFDDIPNYDVKVMKGATIYDLEINAINGSIMSFEIDD